MLTIVRIVTVVLPILIGIGIGVVVFDAVHENMVTWKAVALSSYLGLFVHGVLLKHRLQLAGEE